jgi:uncharacterized protein
LSSRLPGKIRPATVTTEDPALRKKLLDELVGSYLYQDMLEFEGVRRSGKIVDLLRLLTFRIGQEVSVAELATGLALNRQTVEQYLDLLEKVHGLGENRGAVNIKELHHEVARSR